MDAVENEQLAATLRLVDGLAFQARVLNARASQIFETLTGQNAITPRQYGALLTLYQNGPMTLSSLAAAISVDRSTLTEMVRRLLREDQITRTENGCDRRSSLVGLTREGRESVIRLTPGAAQVQDVLLTSLSKSERRQLMHWIKAIAVGGESAGA